MPGGRGNGQPAGKPRTLQRGNGEYAGCWQARAVENLDPELTPMQPAWPVRLSAQASQPERHLIPKSGLERLLVQEDLGSSLHDRAVIFKRTNGQRQDISSVVRPRLGARPLS